MLQNGCFYGKTALLLYVVISSIILQEAHGILPSDNLLKAIAKTIEQYEEGELPRSTTIHFHHDDDGQKRIDNLFLSGIIIWDPLFQHFHGSNFLCLKCRQILKPRSWKDGRDWKHNSPRELADCSASKFMCARMTTEQLAMTRLF